MEPRPNPYEAPQMPVAHLAPAADPAGFAPGELPCHRCGQPVPTGAKTCPACAARPLYDRMQLWLTALLILVAIQVTFLWQLIRGRPETIALSWLIAIVAITAVWFGMQTLFKKLRGGKW